MFGAGILNFLAYLRLPFSDPLLCLTASTTLREKALSLSQSAHPLITYLTRAGMVSLLDPGAVMGGEHDKADEENEDTGFEEINLLEGLTLGSSTSSDAELLHLPSTRLGNTTRQRFFSLPPVSAPARTPPSTSKQTPNHILRQSYRKILQTVSGFRVRMRTVFVPHVLLPKNSFVDQDAHDRNDFESGSEEREAGNSERTVVLCVEVENSGESGPTTGFSLERLDVKIGGEGATTRLIEWGEGVFNSGSDTENHLFPLLIGSMEQYNLLYVVSFWNTPNDQDNFMLTTQGINDGGELQRAVTITVYGRPYLASEVKDENSVLSYPTPTFSSRWNCVLDLSSRPREEPVDFHETSVGRSALPEPASPFPGRTALSSLALSPAPTTPTPQAIAGKRHTLPSSITAMRAINPSANYRLSLPSREYPGGSAMLPAPTTAFTPPSVALQTFNRSASTTFGMSAPPLSGGGGFNVNTLPSETQAQPSVTLHTPAYPMFPPGVTAKALHIQALGSQQGYSGPSVEIKRERGTGMMTAVPQTPFPTVLNTQFDTRQEPLPVPSGEPVVVSVGLLLAESDDGYPFGQKRIYPSDQFTLDIFVYNQSSWTRRFEISYPNVDRQEWKMAQNKAASGSRGRSYVEELTTSVAPPGILPLQNRVRVGPLKPSTCQSVRMDFLSISPGVHSVDILTLTDVETGYAVNLRSVMDIVVHERTAEEMGEKIP
ncbi:TRAPP trafficking subunit Trs65-domain-containing protein [Butyriboletus roseoflavus]|nr:TRAPP trafficking subunit Trs65-domain-containing protein [Butyriboletus roseoflavus]